MAEVTAAMVKQLRDKTQLPMMKCKKALVEAGGDMAAAEEALRKQGEKFIEGRGERSTEEGRIAIYTSPAAGAIVELRLESVQSAGNEEVVQLARDLAEQLATGPGAKTPEELWEQPCPSQPGTTLKAVRDEIANRIREVFRLERIQRIDGPCGGYVHHDGKTGVLLHAEGGDAELAKNIGMQIVSMRPVATNKEELDKELVAKEEAIQKDRARQEGKPENIIDKMIQGRMKSFYAEKVLEEQPYIKDDKTTVGQLAKAGGMKLKGFVRWEVGETTPAAEPAAAAG